LENWQAGVKPLILPTWGFIEAAIVVIAHRQNQRALAVTLSRGRRNGKASDVGVLYRP
jgi:hypothetical protein